MTSAKKDVSADDRKVDAMPTKALFIEMLTRDIKLIPALIDLIDNSVDGAIRLRGKRSFKGLSVRITLSADELRIADNCGGIEVDLARKYAFRFGRPEEAPLVSHSIGKFGVGMKRAFFKIGKRFRIESQAKHSRFKMDVSVTQWAKDKRKWEFEFDDMEEGLKNVSTDKLGTHIIVSDLHDDVAQQFEHPNLQKAVEVAIKSRLQSALSRGLSIVLNGISVGARPLRILGGPQLAPAYKRLVYRKLGAPVTVKLYCGLGSSDPAMAGWHVFCNGRLVLEADKNDVTGWGPDTGLPAFHPQYNSLRGYAYFDSDDAGRLPWNTTKTGMDTGSPIYRAVRPQMITLMRPVIDFLNRLKEEKEGREEGEEKGPFEELVASALPQPVQDVQTRAVFELPKVRARKKAKGPRLQRIQYDRPLSQVKTVMQALEVRSFKKAGEGTFDYFYNAECEE